MEKEVNNLQDKEPTPFTESGQRDDEVVLVFDDDQKLYVSRNFLCYASPVFETMFNIDFKEKKENTVKLVSKSYDAFLEFLLCLHPGVLRKVKEPNVLKIVPIAEEYQVLSIVSECKSYMKNWLVRAAEEAKKYSGSSKKYQIPHLRHCLRICETAYLLSYEDVVTSGVGTLAKFGHDLYDKIYLKNDICQNEKLRDALKECISIFDNLPAELKCRILTKRLELIRDFEFK